MKAEKDTNKELARLFVHAFGYIAKEEIFFPF
jgi:hypothetical protein